MLIKLFGTVFMAMLAACAPSYFGKTYPVTQNVDFYLDAADVKKEYTTIGTTIYNQGLKSLDGMQRKVIEMGKANGADGVIMEMSEKVTATQQNGVGVVNKKNKTYNSSATTVNIKKKQITATFIKYN